ARECAREQGDIWIIYMGHNEMVGPFGATPVFGAQSPSWRAVRMGLAIQKTRIGQWLMGVSRKLTGRSPHAANWGGMKMFMESQVPPSDRHKEVVYQNFKKNLGDILEAGLSSGTHIILNTVAVNLKDFAPLASAPKPGLQSPDREQFEKLANEAEIALNKEDFAAAAASYEQAAKVDDSFAQI